MMNWKEKCARKAIQWLLRYVPEWMVVHKRKWGRNKKRLEDFRRDNSAIRKTALEVAATADLIVNENKLLKAENQRLREEAEAMADIDLVAENARLRAEAEGATDAYNVLLEEMEGQL